jgi:hypothetical protein
VHAKGALISIGDGAPACLVRTLDEKAAEMIAAGPMSMCGSGSTNHVYLYK